MHAMVIALCGGLLFAVLLAGLAVAIGFRCGLFNIGAEGQLFIGALGTAYVGYSIVGLPAYIHLPLALLAGAVAGHERNGANDNDDFPHYLAA